MRPLNPIFDDLARVASGALNAVGGAREEVEARIKEQFHRWLSEMNLVTREEFDVARDMAQKAREENEALAARLAKLEAALKTPTKTAAPKLPKSTD